MATKTKNAKEWQCLECGKLYTTDGARRAMDRGCSKCGGYDIDLADNCTGGERFATRLGA